jgi:hypothetical protein
MLNAAEGDGRWVETAPNALQPRGIAFSLDRN